MNYRRIHGVRGIQKAVGSDDRDVSSAPISGLGHASQNVVYTILAKIIGTYVLALKMVWDVILGFQRFNTSRGVGIVLLIGLATEHHRCFLPKLSQAQYSCFR